MTLACQAIPMLFRQMTWESMHWLRNLLYGKQIMVLRLQSLSFFFIFYLVSAHFIHDRWVNIQSILPLFVPGAACHWVCRWGSHCVIFVTVSLTAISVNWTVTSKQSASECWQASAQCGRLQLTREDWSGQGRLAGWSVTSQLSPPRPSPARVNYKESGQAGASRQTCPGPAPGGHRRDRAGPARSHWAGDTHVIHKLYWLFTMTYND